MTRKKERERKVVEEWKRERERESKSCRQNAIQVTYLLTASIQTNGLAKYRNCNRPALHHRAKNSVANIITHIVSTCSIAPYK